MSKKFQAFIGLAIAITVMTLFKDATFQEWLDGEKWLFGIYCTGNVGEYVAKSYAKKDDPVVSTEG